MAKKKKFFLIITFAYFVIMGIIWYQPLQRIFIREWKNGYYFSKQFDSQQDWVNTKNINTIGANISYEENALQYNFIKQPNQRIIVRILYGIPFQSSDMKEYRGLKKATFTIGNFKDVLPNRTGYVIYRNKNQIDNAGLFSIKLEKSADLLDIRRIEVSVLPPKKDFLPNLPLFGLFLSIPFLLMGFWKKWKKGFIYLVLTLVIFVGASLRWQEIERVAFAPVHPDAHHVPTGCGYYERAKNMKLFDREKGFLAASYDQHEPGYPLIVKAVFSIIGSSLLHLRFISFFFALISMILMFLIGSRIIGYFQALLATGLISINHFLVEQASYGLRTELEMVTLLLFFWMSFYGIKKMRFSIWLLATGLLAGWWVIIRSFNLVAVIVIGAISIMYQRRSWRIRLVAMAIFTILALGLITPYKYNLSKKYGNPFWDINRYASDHAIYEFGNLSDRYKQNLTLSEYFFQLHNPYQIIINSVVGFFVIGINYYQELFSLIHISNNLIKTIMKDGLVAIFANYLLDTLISLGVFILFIVGLFYGSFTKISRKTWLLISLAISYNSFFYGTMVFKKGGILETHRTIAHALPLVAYIFSSGIFHILEKNKYTRFVTKI